MRRDRIAKCVAPLWALALPASSAGQDTIHLIVGEGSGNLPGFGYSVAATGDVDGDGVSDLIAGAPYESSFLGQAKVYSGSTGALVPPKLQSAQGSHYGFSVAGVGDLDGDGLADVLVGDPQFGGVAPGGKGQADCWSLATGTVLHHVAGDQASDELGYSVAAAGDVDADGFPDFAVGAVEDHDFFPGPGYVRVFSGSNGAVLLNMSHGSVGARFGQSVTGAGDVDGDGSDDLLIGASHSGNGFAQMRSGLNGAVLWTAVGSLPLGRFGWDLDFAGDVDGDGEGDVVIGASGGYFDVRRARDGVLVRKVIGPEGDFFGGAVAGAGDVDKDGHADLLVGAKWADGPTDVFAGKAWVYSGSDFEVLREFAGEANGDRVGFSTAGIGDVDQDGFPDIAIGANQELNSGPGFVRVESGRPPLAGDTAAISLLSGGVQTLSLDLGQAFAGNGYVILGSLSGTSPGVHVSGHTIPLNPDAWFAWTFSNPGAPPLVGSIGTLDADGRASAAFALPAGLDPALAGTALDHAAIAFDAPTSKITFVTNPVGVDLVP